MGTRLRPALVLILTSCAPAIAQPIRISAEAAPQSLYAEWARGYESKSKVRSSRGLYQEILSLESTGVDLGGIDLPLSVAQLRAKGLVQFPTAIGGVVPIANIPGVAPGALHLSGAILARILLGEITRWNDPVLTALNQGLPLPDVPIRPVHPTEPSGTTFIFTTYLAEQSAAWHSRVGAGLTVDWPVGEARTDTLAVAAFVQKTIGALGFSDYAVAADTGVGKPALQNRVGQFVSPTTASFQAAAKNAPWEQAPAFALSLVDQGGAGSWPLVAPTYAILPLRMRSPERTLDLLRFLDWGFRSSGGATAEAGFVPLPASVVDLVEAAWKRQLKGPDGKPVWGG
jgi:phosphate transport system substrate-binding protein